MDVRNRQQQLLLKENGTVVLGRLVSGGEAEVNNMEGKWRIVWRELGGLGGTPHHKVLQL